MSENANTASEQTVVDTNNAAAAAATEAATTGAVDASSMTAATTTPAATTTYNNNAQTSYGSADMAAIESGVLQMAQAAAAARAAEQSEHDRNLIVNYVPQSVNELSFQALFAPYGEIERCKLMMDLQTGSLLLFCLLFSL